MVNTVDPEAVAFKKLKSEEADLVVVSSKTLPVYESPVDAICSAVPESSISCVTPLV